MVTYLISDTHLNRNQPEVYDRFIHYLNAIGADADELYILGDLFDYWIGDDGIELLGHNAAVEALGKLSAAGVRISIMHGNRDFLIGREFVEKIGASLIADPTRISLGGQQVLLMHGDSLCTDDIAHQRYRAVVLSPEWQEMILQLPVAERFERALSMRAASESNKPKVNQALMDVNQSAVLHAMKEFNVNVLIHGHTHRPQVHRFVIDGNSAARYVLGDWGRGYDAVIRATSDGIINLHHAVV